MWFNFNVMPPAFKTVAVIGRYNTAEIAESLLGLAALLQQRGCAVLIEKETAANIGGNGFSSGDYAAIADRILFLDDGEIVRDLPRSDAKTVIAAMEEIGS